MSSYPCADQEGTWESVGIALRILNLALNKIRGPLYGPAALSPDREPSKSTA